MSGKLIVTYLSKGMPEMPWAQGGPGVTPGTCGAGGEGPSDPTVGEGPGCWERLPPTETRGHEGNAIIYA